MSDFVILCATIATGLQAIGLVAGLIRLVKGPTVPDRVVALDLMALLTLGVSVTLSVAMERPILLEPAIVLALLAFIGTVAFARYLEDRV